MCVDCGECMSTKVSASTVVNVWKTVVNAGRFLLNFHWGGNVLKGHSKWLKRAPYALLIFIYITLRNV